MGDVKGAKDELEVLQMIICSNKVLLQRVLDKIRIHRALSQETMFDAAKKRDDKNKEMEQKKEKKAK